MFREKHVVINTKCIPRDYGINGDIEPFLQDLENVIKFEQGYLIFNM